MLRWLPMPPQLDRTITIGATIAVGIALPYVIVLVALAALGWLSVTAVVFWILAAVIVAGACGAVFSNHIVHAALSLVIAAMGVAGIFLLLASEFLALVQVLVYGGGVTILLLFGLMLTNASEDPLVTDGTQKPFAFGIGLALGAAIVAAMVGGAWHGTVKGVVSLEDLGVRLYRDFGLPFEVASLVLIVAPVGAIAIGRRDREEDAS